MILTNSKGSSADFSEDYIFGQLFSITGYIQDSNSKSRILSSMNFPETCRLIPQREWLLKRFRLLQVIRIRGDSFRGRFLLGLGDG